MRVLELKGYKSLKAFNAFHTLMLGLKMLPSYMTESYEDFYDKIENKTEAEQERLIREAALFVTLNQEEIEAIICFCTDANGVPYGPANLKSLGPKELLDCIVAVSLEIAKIKLNLVSDSEKKNLETSLSTSEGLSQRTLASH